MCEQDHKFRPCVARDHSHCTGVYRSESGASVRCVCQCHNKNLWGVVEGGAAQATLKLGE